VGNHINYLKQEVPFHSIRLLNMAAVSVKVGVLCIQGAFIEHVRKLQEIEQKFTKCTISIVEVRQPKDLEEIDGLIIPGGESTTLSVFLAQNDFERQMNLWLNKKKIVWGTCAGMILLSDSLEGQKKGGQIKVVPIIV
jgi:5'-phosphate synthase pdxT subunit